MSSIFPGARGRTAPLKVEARLQSRKPPKDSWFVPLEASSQLLTSGAPVVTAPLNQLVSVVSVAPISTILSLQQETQKQQPFVSRRLAKGSSF